VPTGTNQATRTLLLCGVAAGPIYVVVGGLQVLLRDGYDLTRHPLSLISNGDLGWVLGLLIPGMLAALQRTPQGLHGDWWRTSTALFVQDGGVVGTLSNLAFLLVMGVVAEQGPGGVVVLLAARDLHGAAMVAGIVIAAVIGRQGAGARP